MIKVELKESQDIKELRAAKAAEGNEPTIPVRAAKKELGLNDWQLLCLHRRQ